MTSKDVLQRLETWGIDDADSEELHALLADAARELRDTRVGLAACNRVRQQERRAHETTGWYVEERLEDGTFRRWATAHIWDSNEDAHRQRDELAKFYPRKIFAVTSVRSSVEPTVSTESDCSTGTGGVTLMQMAENIKLGLGPYEGSSEKPSVRKAEHFDIFPDDGCNRCPWVGGVMAERDCHFPDCMPEWKPNDDPNGWRPIHTAPKNGRFQVALEGIPEHAWPAYRTDGGSIYSNAHGILNSKVHGRLTVATHWRPSQPAPFQPDFLRYPHHPRSRG